MKIYQPLPKDMQNKEYLTEGKEYHNAEFFIILIGNKSLNVLIVTKLMGGNELLV